MTSVVCLSGVGGTRGEWNAVVTPLGAFGHFAAAAPPQGPLIVVGHSQGGVRALRLAAAQPDRVRAIVLTSSFFPPARAGRSLGDAAVDYGRHRLLYLRELTGRRRAPSPTRRGFRQMAAVTRLGLRPAAFHRLAGAVRCPVLVVHGDRDHVVPIAFARAAVAAHPAWELRELADAGHHPHRDRPREWAGVVTDWLAHRTARVKSGECRRGVALRPDPKEDEMSVFMMLQVTGDAKRIKAVMEANGEAFETINARARANGAIHHRFLSSSDGSTIAVFDEWESEDGFNTFFNSSPEIPQMMAEAGVTTPPQVTFWHPVDTPDAF